MCVCVCVCVCVCIYTHLCVRVGEMHTCISAHGDCLFLAEFDDSSLADYCLLIRQR